jgi:hypothetical protein
VVVDVANVMGARPDGWWRDRAGAALRLGREVDALARRGDEATSQVREWVLVLEGKAREAAGALLADERDERDERDEGEPPFVRVVSAPRSGDDAIVGVVAEFAARGETCLVVTADRELRQRCEELNASVAGPGWLLRLLQQVTLKNNHPHLRIARCGQPVRPIDRNLMRMYVILIVVVLLILLVAGLLVVADRATEVVRRARKRRAAGERLAAAAARAEEKSRARDAADEASGALTTVLPAILVEDHEPRHVALASGGTLFSLGSSR